jgi:hypothetical protein
MAYEVRDMSGSVFKNTRKTSEKSADMTGAGRLFGRDVWINCWVKTDKNGEKWISFSFKEKEKRSDRGSSPEPRREAPPAKDDFPF